MSKANEIDGVQVTAGQTIKAGKLVMRIESAGAQFIRVVAVGRKALKASNKGQIFTLGNENKEYTMEHINGKSMLLKVK